MKNKLIILMILLFSTLTSCSIIDNTNSFIGKIFDIFGTKANDNYKYTIWNISFRLTEDKEERTINDKVLNEYIEHYGLIKEKFKIDFLGYDSGSSIRGVHGWLGRNWIRAYEIRAPFMERPFEVWVDNRTHEIFGDNFYEVLSRDDKFQHLYSEWVKKEVGIEDEDVELKFGFSNDSIDFKHITHLSADYGEIFEEYPYILQSIEFNRQVENTDKANIFKEYFNKFYDKVVKDVENSFYIIFNKDSNNYIGIKDYKGYILLDIGGRVKELNLNAICTYRQLNDILNNYQILNNLNEIIVPKYYINCEVKHWLTTEDVNAVDNTSDIIKRPDGKYYQDNIIRLDLSNSNSFVVDILYCKLADDISYVYDSQTRGLVPISEYKYYNSSGKRVDVYYDNGKKLNHPLFLRYTIELDGNDFKVLDSKKIANDEYLGKNYNYIYE